MGKSASHVRGNRAGCEGSAPSFFSALGALRAAAPPIASASLFFFIVATIAPALAWAQPEEEHRQAKLAAKPSVGSAASSLPADETDPG